MRVTNSMLVSNFMRNLNTNMSKLGNIQDQLSTGRKYPHISDDPVALIYSQAARNKLTRLSHYRTTVSTAQQWLSQAELGVMELQGNMVDAYEGAVDAAKDFYTAEDKLNLSRTIGQLRDHFVDTLNTAFGDKYVFGGYNTPGDQTQEFAGEGAKPFTVKDNKLYYNGYDLSQYDWLPAGDYYNMQAPAMPPEVSDPLNPPQNPGDPGYAEYQDYLAELENYNIFQTLQSDKLMLDVGPGITMPVTMNGIELVFVTTTNEMGEPIIRNAFNVMQDLFTATESNKPAEEISGMIKYLQAGQNHLLSKTAEIGGRTRRLDLLEARYEQDFINYTQMKSDAEDIEMGEVIMNQKMAESVYQAALSAGARVIQPTLMDFLR